MAGREWLTKLGSWLGVNEHLNLVGFERICSCQGILNFVRAVRVAAFAKTVAQIGITIGAFPISRGVKIVSTAKGQEITAILASLFTVLSVATNKFDPVVVRCVPLIGEEACS